jgi:TRAP-type C4-dicarboxylate transport system permease small subunit
MVALLSKILNLLSKVEKMIAATCIAALTLLMVMDVGKREFLREGIPWAQKLALYFMIWAGLLGAALTSAKGGHLRPEIADKIWPQSLHPILKTIEQFFIAIFSFTMGYIALEFVMESYKLGDKNPVTEISLWTVQSVIPYSLFSMGLRHIIYTFFSDLRPKDMNEAEEALAAEQEGHDAIEGEVK